MTARGPQRTIADIDRDIASTEAALRRLHSERRASVAAYNAEIVADFDAGMSFAEIAEKRGLTYASTQGILYRLGRTLGGRTAMKDRLREIGAGVPA